MTSHETIQYFQLGMGYYVAGRYAAYSHFGIVTGLLCHHAIEMFLKGKLVEPLGRDVLKNKLCHNLPKIWEKFKAEVGGEPLDQFNETIRKLHEFEDIRYPDQIVDKGGMVTVTTGGGAPSDSPTPTDEAVSGLSYTLVLSEIDALARAIFQAAGIDPDFFTRSMKNNRHALEFLEKNNAIFGVSAKEIEVAVSDISTLPEGIEVAASDPTILPEGTDET